MRDAPFIQSDSGDATVAWIRQLANGELPQRSVSLTSFVFFLRTAFQRLAFILLHELTEDCILASSGNVLTAVPMPVASPFSTLSHSAVVRHNGSASSRVAQE